MELIITNESNLKDLIGNAIQEKLIEFSHWLETKKNDEDKTLTRKQAAQYLGVSLSTLDTWAKNGIIKSHGIGGKVFYKMSDINSSMKTIN